jgi:hypothetical protein
MGFGETAAKAVFLFRCVIFPNVCSWPHRVISLPRGNCVAFGLKRTLGWIL